MHRLSKLAFLALFATVVFAEPVRAQDDVILPDGAIDATEILDEPGTSQKLLLESPALSSEAVVAIRDSLIAPSDGYVLVFVSGRFGVHDFGGLQINNVEYGLSSNCDSPSIEDVQKRIITYGDGGLFGFTHPVATQQVYLVSAGVQTFCLVAKLIASPDAGEEANFDELTLSLLFIPTAYGTVETN